MFDLIRKKKDRANRRRTLKDYQCFANLPKKEPPALFIIIFYKYKRSYIFAMMGGIIYI